jgi:molybdopterin/thiamine biosynthesis adenylyltransferase/rhodanese-related sulfurtransferase
MPNPADYIAAIRASIPEIDCAQASAMMAQGALMLDVREPDEHAQGAIPGAVHIPRGMLELEVAAKVPDRERAVIVYCAAGIRSALAVRTLAELGYTNARSLHPGFTGWKNEGFEWATPSTFTADQRARYSRHLVLPEIGTQGQQALLDARVVILGAGGLGSPAALYLAAAGVGTIGIVDDDVVDTTNLQRQILHDLHRVGEQKVESARQTLTALNSDVKVEGHATRLNASNAADILSRYDVIVDGTDNFPTRYLVNDVSLHLGTPVVHGSIFRFDGQASVFSPYTGPCYRCLFPEPPPPELAPNCAEAGVLGVLPGIVGSIQATETIKLILGIGESLVGRLLLYDALEQDFTTVRIARNPECPACGDPDSKPPIKDYDASCRV